MMMRMRDKKLMIMLSPNEAVKNVEDKDEEENFEVLRPSSDVGIMIQDINAPAANQ